MLADPELDVLADAPDDKQRQWLTALVERTKTLMLLDNEFMGGKACDDPERAHQIHDIWQQLDRSFNAIRERHPDWLEDKPTRDARLDAKVRARVDVDDAINQIRRIQSGEAKLYTREEVRRELGLQA